MSLFLLFELFFCSFVLLFVCSFFSFRSMFLDFTFTFQIVRPLFKLEFNFTLEFYIRLFASFSCKILYGDESKN